jgi:carbamoyltransferase
MYRPRNPTLGRLASNAWRPIAARKFAKAGMFAADSTNGNAIIENVRMRVRSGETCYLVGLGISGHNAGASLVQVSKAEGIQLLSNDEEERFNGVKHFEDYPEMAIVELRRRLKSRGIKPAQVAAWYVNEGYNPISRFRFRLRAVAFQWQNEQYRL